MMNKIIWFSKVTVVLVGISSFLSGVLLGFLISTINRQHHSCSNRVRIKCDTLNVY